MEVAVDKSIKTLSIKSELEDLTHQENLTTQLYQSTPLYEPIKSETELLDKISQSLNLPISIESWGETAVDKISR